MPSFTVEAEGETVPLTVETVYSTLLQASGQQGGGVQAIKVATKQLANWESQPGYYSALQDLYSNPSLDHNVRLLAVLQLKNGIDKHWRKGSTTAISKDEKMQIRNRALESGVKEPARPVALHNALVIAKVVRYDFPHDWPDVMSLVINQVRNCMQPAKPSYQVRDILIITLEIVKELATGRLQRTRKSLQSIASELFQALGTLYVHLVTTWLSFVKSSGDDEGGAVNCAENSYSALKAIRRLAIVGFENPHREQEVQQFWSILQEHQAEFWPIWQRGDKGNAGSYLIEIVARHLLQMSKLHLEMARVHPASFMLLPGALPLLELYWSAITDLGERFVSERNQTESAWQVQENGAESTFSPLEKISLKALLLLRACIKMVYQPAQTFKYQQPQDKEDKKAAIDLITSTVLTENFVVSMMETVVTQFFVLRPSDLREWEQEPDEWEKREEEIADAWEFSLRSCSEKLFLDIVINFKQQLVPRLLQVFYQYATIENQDVFLKDSLYSAVGIAAACLEDRLDFNAFLQQTLVREVQVDQPRYNLLRRRTTTLLGQWVPVKPDALDRPAIYQIFANLLSKDDALNDMVVRVTAGRQLRLVLEPFEFKQTEFAPYATSIFQSLMGLIQETELSETKMAILETVRVAVSRLERHIAPYADAIMSMLPPLWAESGEEHLMKQAILTMITTIITSLKQQSLAYHSSVLPLIHDSVQPDSEAAVYLLEEAIDLWTAILQQTPTESPTPELLALSTSLLPLAQTGSDTLHQVFDLIEAYIVLSPQTCLTTSDHQPSFCTSILHALACTLDGKCRLSDFQRACHIVETMLATLWLPSLHKFQVSPLERILTCMIQSGFLAVVMKLLKAAYVYNADPRPSREPPDVIGPKETALFNVLSHTIQIDPSTALGAVSSVMQSSWTWLITEWIGHFDSIGSIQDKKLQALAVTNLLQIREAGSPPAFMLEQLQSLMTMWTDVVNALGEDAPEESQGDYLWYGYDTSSNGFVFEECPEVERKSKLSKVDPVHTNNIRVFIRKRLGAAVEATGAQVFQEHWLSRVDGAVVQSFGQLGLL